MTIQAYTFSPYLHISLSYYDAHGPGTQLPKSPGHCGLPSPQEKFGADVVVVGAAVVVVAAAVVVVPAAVVVVPAAVVVVPGAAVVVVPAAVVVVAGVQFGKVGADPC